MIMSMVNIVSDVVNLDRCMIGIIRISLNISAVMFVIRVVGSGEILVLVRNEGRLGSRKFFWISGIVISVVV